MAFRLAPDDAHDLAILAARILRQPGIPRLPIDQSTQIALRLTAHDLRADSPDAYETEAADVLETYARLAPVTRNGTAAQWDDETEALKARAAKPRNPRSRRDHPQTSKTAARHAKEEADKTKAALLVLLRERGRLGLTLREGADMVAERFDVKPTTNRVSSRFGEMVTAGTAVRTEERRETSRSLLSNGRVRVNTGHVYAVAVEAARQGGQP